MSQTATFALALEQLDGVGRVTAGRLLARFATYEEVRRTPREQVLTRIKGAPNAEALVHRLFDDEAMQPHFDAAKQTLQHLRRRRVRVLTARDAAWPARLDDLPRSQRPALLYTFGCTSALRQPIAALFARPPLHEKLFERAQDLVRLLAAHHVLPGTGAAHSFDVVMHKITTDNAAPSVLVAHAGLQHMPRPLRPVASQAVKAGGVLASPFPMQHGPYDHDDALRAFVLAALARACIFIDPQEGTAEWKALTWALEAGRPVFGASPAETPLPPQVRPLARDADFDAVLAAAS